MNARTAAHWVALARVRVLFVFLAFEFAPLLVFAQSPPAPGESKQQPAPENSTPEAAPQNTGSQDSATEMNTHETATPFSVRVNLVPIRVVVRDSRGKPVPNLHADDFHVFEGGKPQLITLFSAETPAPEPKSPETESSNAAASEKTAPLVRPTRFVALLFDDVHSTFGDLARIRNIAVDYVANSILPNERVAVFTFSGQSQIDFTDDLAKIRETLMQVQPRSVTAGTATGVGQCPSIDFYQADLIQNAQDAQATTVATLDALTCEFNNDRRFMSAAFALAQSTAAMTFSTGDMQTEYSLLRLREITKRMSVLSGQRLIVLLSPGFLTPTRFYELSEVIDNATRSNVVISTLDSRGLYTIDASPDISEPAIGDPTAEGIHVGYRVQGQLHQSDVMYSLADGTGGSRFDSSNDLVGGFRRVVSSPDVSYLIGFVPQNLKYDGKFHSVKVSLASKEKYTIQARAGFYAPKQSETPADAVKQEIEEAVLSQEEQHGLPVQLHTQYYKVDATDAKLAVLTHVDLGHIHFNKVDGRNRNDLTVVAAIFDRNGNFVAATEKVLEMRLRDATLEKLKNTGVTVRTSFDVKPGAYAVRLVVRDSQDSQLSAENGVVEIPY